LANTTWWAWFWGEIEHWAFLAVVVALAIEFAALKFGTPYKDKLESAKDLKLAELNNETARLRSDSAANAEAALANARAGRANALAAQSVQTTAEILAIATGLVAREAVSESARSLYIISAIKPFAGKQFDVTSSGFALETFLGSLRQALKMAGWIEVDRSDADTMAHHDGQSNIGGPALVKIHVDATKISELWDAAEALASALKAEGIEAIAEQLPTPENSNSSAIHIVIGPKAQ
jgi:hypothetical protein